MFSVAKSIEMNAKSYFVNVRSQNFRACGGLPHSIVKEGMFRHDIKLRYQKLPDNVFGVFFECF